MRTMIVVTGVDSPQIYGSGDDGETQVSSQPTAQREQMQQGGSDIDFIE